MGRRYPVMAALALAAALGCTGVLAQTPAPAAPAATPRGPPHQFLQIKDGLWRASNGNWWSLIYDTPDGLLIGSTISRPSGVS